MRMFDFIRSIRAGLRASGIMGRGFRLRDRGDFAGAMVQARMGLRLLNQPFVRRDHPMESSVLVGLTILAEQAALELNESGASSKDIADSIALLKEPSDPRDGLSRFLPFLEARLALASCKPQE